MKLPRTEFKHALAAGQVRIGMWSGMCSTVATEILCDAGFDWILIDGEHAPNTLPQIMAQLQVMGASSRPYSRRAPPRGGRGEKPDADRGYGSKSDQRGGPPRPWLHSLPAVRHQ